MWATTLIGLGRPSVSSDSEGDEGMGNGKLVLGPHSIQPLCSTPQVPICSPLLGLEDPLNPCLPPPFSTQQTYSLGTSSNTVPPSSPQPLPHAICFLVEVGAPQRFPQRSVWRPVFLRPRTSQPEEGGDHRKALTFLSTSSVPVRYSGNRSAHFSGPYGLLRAP